LASSFLLDGPSGGKFCSRWGQGPFMEQGKLGFPQSPLPAKRGGRASQKPVDPQGQGSQKSEEGKKEKTAYGPRDQRQGPHKDPGKPVHRNGLPYCRAPRDFQAGHRKNAAFYGQKNIRSGTTTSQGPLWPRFGPGPWHFRALGPWRPGFPLFWDKNMGRARWVRAPPDGTDGGKNH